MVTTRNAKKMRLIRSLRALEVGKIAHSEPEPPPHVPTAQLWRLH